MKTALKLACAGIALLATTALNAQEPRIAVEQGNLAGKRLEDGGILFAGIPYAAPPIGPLRWKPPADPAHWPGLRDATMPGAACPQPNIGWNAWDAAHSAEDCLSLNVWVPPGDAKALPVMVWIHGGGFIGGSGSAPTYDGTALTKAGVILVTVNYRLGVLGFLAHPELSAESLDHLSGNYGLMDQTAALAWVHRNIAQFGGDPANVTVFGQSAGSISTGSLITIPEARRYFKRAILQSGTPFGIGELPALAEIEPNNAAFGHIANLRTMSAAEVVASWGRYSAAAPAQRLAIPLIDGKVLQRQPEAAYRAGMARSVPLLVGSVVREIPPAGHDALVDTARKILGAEATKVISDYESRGTDPAAGDPDTQMMTDMQFRCGTIMAARFSDRSWLYHFFENFPGRGAPAHSAEVFYVFDSAPGAQPGGAPLDPAQRRLSQTMIGYWTNFAKTGNPNGPGLPVWPRYSTSEGRYAEFAAAGVRAARGLRHEACTPFIRRWTKRVR